MDCATITITGGRQHFHFIPGNVKLVYDFSSHDTLLGGVGPETTYYLHGNTEFLGFGGSGKSVIHAEGKDTVFAGRGAVTVDGGSERLVFVGGAGKADLHLESGKAVIYDESGPITVGGGTGAATLFGGRGAITFDDKHSKGHDLFVTGHGNAHVTLGGGTATVDGGTGKSTITAGTGHDIFEFVAGHGGGTEVIKDFSEQRDKIELKGKFTAPPTEKLTHGGLVITLTDGTQVTHIDLSGIHGDVKL